MSKDQIHGTWSQLKGKVKQNWGELTDDDINRIDGKIDRLSGTLQKKYGYTKQKAEQEIQTFFDFVNKSRK